MSRLGWMLPLVAAMACNQVAVLEGELTLPPRPAEFDELWVSVQAMRSTTPLEDTWAGAALDPVALTDAPQRYVFSLQTKDPEGDLHVKVRFCRREACDFLPGEPDERPDPQAEMWFVLEHPFYLMKKDPEPTRWRAEVRRVPSCERCPDGSCSEGTCNPDRNECELEPGVCVLDRVPEGCVAVAGQQRPTLRCDVDKCAIEGCIAGTTTSYCDTLEDGTRVHLCER